MRAGMVCTKKWLEPKSTDAICILKRHQWVVPQWWCLKIPKILSVDSGQHIYMLIHGKNNYLQAILSWPASLHVRIIFKSCMADSADGSVRHRGHSHSFLCFDSPNMWIHRWSHCHLICRHLFNGYNTFVTSGPKFVSNDKYNQSVHHEAKKK